MNCKVTLLSAEEFKTKKQLGYYYGVIIPIAANGFRARGNFTDEERTDYLLRMELFNEVIHDAHGGVVKFPCAIQDASKAEMSKYIDDCINWCAIELGVVIPAPPQAED